MNSPGEAFLEGQHKVKHCSNFRTASNYTPVVKRSLNFFLIAWFISITHVVQLLVRGGVIPLWILSPDVSSIFAYVLMIF